MARCVGVCVCVCVCACVCMCVCVCVCACVVIGYGLELSIMYIYPRHKKIQNVFYSDAFASSAYICVSLGASTHALPYDA